jgi:uncharacterized protein YjdB
MPVEAQSDSLMPRCGTDADFIASMGIDTSIHSPVPAFAPSAIFTCGGLIDVYYEDINLHTGAGFDDPTIGATRRATLCQVLYDIQATLDFSKKISPLDHIRIHVAQSLAPGTSVHATPGTLFYANAGPHFNSTVPGITAGWLNQYVTTGSDLAPSGDYHASMQVNFDKIIDISGNADPIYWQNDTTTSADCLLDLYTVLFHEMTHALGWISFVRFSDTCCGATSLSCGCVYGKEPLTYTTPVSIRSITANLYTKLDTAITAMPGSSSLLPSSLVHLVINSGGLYIINPSAYNANHNYWMNSFGAPDNHPAFSGLVGALIDTASTKSFLSHVEDDDYSYSFRQRVSPGDRQPYVMGPYGFNGVYHRTYTKGELQTLVRTLGYDLTTGYATSYPNIIPNHVPFSQKMASMGINEYTYFEFTEDASTIDYSLVNNIGSSKMINLADAVFSTGDLIDADYDAISIDTSTVVNFRGCGIGWDNHYGLTMISPTKILYTPRPNFYGKAQFGFNITDGKEDGSFRVVTIDVKRGNQVNPSLGSGNLICNPDFEEGSEIRTTGYETENNPYLQSYIHEGKWQGVSFSDSHPYIFHSNEHSYGGLNIASGCAVKQSFIACTGAIVKDVEGDPKLSFPFFISGSFDNPNPPSGGYRYQMFPGADTMESYYYLDTNISSCNMYVLSFDVYKPNDGLYCPSCLSADLKIAFGDSLGSFSHYYNFTAPAHAFPLLLGSWNHVTDTFWYCSDTVSNILSIKSKYLEVFDIDNMSLIQIKPNPAMGVTIAATRTGTSCQWLLTPTITIPGCTTSKYLWAGPGLSCTTCSTETAPAPSTATTYSLTVSDKCGFRTASTTITISPMGVITGSVPLCAGSTIVLVDTSSAGTWTSSNTTIAIVGLSSGIVTGIAGGTAKITYSIGTCSTYITVTINPIPASITGSSSVCVGSTSNLSDASSGGTWSSNNTAIATVGVTSGVVTGISTGTTIITYLLSGCYATKTISVILAPASITGSTTICAGSTTTLSDATTGGTWTSSNTTVATVNFSTGIVSGLTAGTSAITYSIGSCYVTATVTINPLPAFITGPTSVCVGSIITLSDATSGGIWSSSVPAYGSIDAVSGMVTGISTGTTFIIYTLPTGCFVAMPVAVNPLPSFISGITEICAGSTAALSDATGGGTWSSDNTTVAMIGATSGIVTGVAAGTADITYKLSTGCLTSGIVTVDPLPATITGGPNACLGKSITLSDATSGGGWSSSNTTVATIGTGTGIVSSVATGTAIITYTLPTGCITTLTITVNALPPAITGTTSVCPSQTVTLSDGFAGGTWTSAATTIAIIGLSSGVMTGVTTGTTTITYTSVAGCTTTTTVTVKAGPGPILGPTSVCAGQTVTLSDAVSGGGWISINTTIATISSGGVVTGVSAGSTTIVYFLPTTGCSVSTVITVLAAPTVVTGFMITCAGSYTTLSDAVSGGVWSSSNTMVATVTAGTGVVTGQSAGTVTITYGLGTGCYATATVTVTGSVGTCSPCSYFGYSFSILGASGSITTTVTAGNYYIGNDVWVYGTGLFKNAIILIAPGVTIHVEPASSLKIDGSHLFSCGMWQGMVLDYTPTSSGILSVVNGSLIEDAMDAVLIMHPVARGALNVFTSDNAIFNRNYFGVDIENYTPPSSAYASLTYPFLIRNTVFTSRYFETCWPLFPTSWPTTIGGSNSLKKPWSHPTNPFLSPFNIDNPDGVSTSVAYAVATCNNGYMPYVGVYLSNIGTENMSGVVGGSAYIPATYAEIVIGDDGVTDNNANQNLFDHCFVGISANTANVTAVNNGFTNMIPDTRAYAWPSVGAPSGDGVYANSIDDAIHQKRLRVYSSPGSAYNNLFYNFMNGVESHNYYQLVGQHTYMINTPLVGSRWLPAPQTGLYGYRVSATHYDTTDISTDTIYAVNTGVAFWATGTHYYGTTIGLPSISQFAGECNVSNNLISPNPTYSPSMTQTTQTGIAVQNVPGTGFEGPSLDYSVYLNKVNVDNNQIYDAYNGIYVNNFFQQPATSNTNNIRMRQYGNKPVQYGINHTSCFKNTIYDNYVTSSTGSSLSGKDSSKAIYSASNVQPTVACNREDNIGRGYEFFLGNPRTYWHDNTMQSNLRGMVLNAAVINQQGSSVAPAGNQWLTPSSWTPASGNYATWEISSNTLSDIMYVYSGSSTTNLASLYNNGNPPGLRYATGYGSLKPTTSSSDPLPCPVNQSEYVSYEYAAQQAIPYPYNSVASNWMGQFALWNSMQVDTTITDSSTVLHVFDSIAESGSRYAYLTDIATQIELGNFDSATTMLGYNIDSMANTDTDVVTGVRMADNTDADNIVINYQNFFGLYIKYMDTLLTSTDSLSILALAQLCPERNGTVVYQARALYSFIYNDLSMFNDDSCITADTSYIAERHSKPTVPGDSSITQVNAGQQYKLYPNPSHGLITVLQNVPDKLPVHAEIWNGWGMSIYKSDLLFNGSIDQIRLANVTPGLYLLKLTDSEGRKFIFKFVEE